MNKSYQHQPTVRRVANRFCGALLLILGSSGALANEPLVLNVWPERPPGETRELPPEGDQTKPEDKLIAGRRIIKLGNVSTPQIAVFRPAAERDTGAAVVICPGGGHHILASALRQAGGSAELHVYATGGHGYGLRPTEQAVTRWPTRAAEWLQELGFLPGR